MNQIKLECIIEYDPEEYKDISALKYEFESALEEYNMFPTNIQIIE